MTKVWVQPRSCDQDRSKNDAFTLSATLLTGLKGPFTYSANAETAFAEESFIEREREQNLVRAENRVHCLQSEILGSVRNGFCVQPINALNLGYVTKYTYVTALIQTNRTQCNSMQLYHVIYGHRNLSKKIF